MNRIKKSVIFTAFIILFLFSVPSTKAFALNTVPQTPQSTESLMNEQRDQSGTSKLNDKIPESAKKSLNSLGVKSGDQNSFSRFTPANVFNTIIDNLKSTAAAPFKAAAAVLGILLACALLNTLGGSVSEKSLQGVFNIVSSLCVASVILLPVTQCVSYCARTINGSSTFMLTFLPVYASLAAVSGHPASAIATQSLLLVSSEGLSYITATTFVPMVDIYLAFCVIGAVSPGINITGVAGFIKNAVSWALGLCLTIYTGILAVQGVIAAAADNVTMKTAKFVVDGAVPVIGSAISDAMNTVISCAGLLKTTVGAYAIVVFVLAFLPPVLECILWLLVADMSLAVAEILGIANMSGLLKAMREALKLIVALVLASALVMIISVSVMLLLGMGN